MRGGRGEGGPDQAAAAAAAAALLIGSSRSETTDDRGIESAVVDGAIGQDGDKATRLAALELLAHGYRGFSTGDTPVPRRVVRRLLRQLTEADEDIEVSP